MLYCWSIPKYHCLVATFRSIYKSLTYYLKCYVLVAGRQASQLLTRDFKTSNDTHAEKWKVSNEKHQFVRPCPRPSYRTAWYVLIILFRPPINTRLGEATLDSNISSLPRRKVESRSPVHSGVKTTLTLTAATAERGEARQQVAGLPGPPD